MGRVPWSTDASARGQSNPIALVLVFALVVGSTAVVVVFGATAIEDTQQQLGSNTAENAMTQFDSQSSLVALGAAEVQTVTLGADGANEYTVDGGAGWLNVSLTSGGSKTTVLNRTLGEVTYTGGDSSVIAYQGGGVWRSSDDGDAVMVSPPEFHYRNATLTLPLVAIRGDESLANGARISHDNSTQYYPNTTLRSGFTNPVSNGVVTVTVGSDYYRAWGQYFETRTEGEVSYDHGAETATITLTTPAGDRRVSSATAATAGGTLTIDGNGARTDNYTSAGPTGYVTGDNHGTVRTAGDIIVTGNGELRGNVTAGGSVTVGGSGTVDAARIEYGSGGCPVPPSSGIDCSQISGFDSAAPVDSYVETRYAAIRSNGTDHGSITSSQTLAAGDHHADEIDLQSGETVTIDTNGGDVNISVRNYVHLGSSGGPTQGELVVTGPNEVNVFLRGESSPYSRAGRERQFAVEGGAIETTHSPENASQLWIYGTQSLNASVWQTPSGSGVTGVIYAPGGATGTGQFYIGQGDFFGGVVTSAVQIDQFGAVHYDSSLRNERAVPRETDLVTVTYIHASVHTLNVTSG